MRKLHIFIVAFIVFVVATIFVSNYLLNSGSILKKFSIISVENKYTEYEIAFDDVKAAEYYRIVIHDANNNKVLDYETEESTNVLSLTNLEYGTEYEVMVYAYDKVGDYRPAEEPYTFVWDEPSFSVDNSLVLNNEDYVLYIDGDVERKDYYINIKRGEEELVNEKIEANEYNISKDLYVDQTTSLEVSIVDDDVVVDTINLYNNQNPVSDITITSPVVNSSVAYNDVTFSFEGGENADSYEIAIYNEDDLIKKTNIQRNICILSKNLFDFSKSYRVVITATYGDYSKSAEVNFMMSSQEQLKPVYISNNWKYVKKGTKITLASDNTDAKIYYTLDGSNPESYGHLYTEPIEINENVTLKAVAVSENKINSIIKEYEINVGEKTDLKVFVSPSNQYANYGVTDVGYTNERDEMNDLSDYIIERLEQYGVTVYRNNSSGNINSWLRDSNYLGVDLHIAIHSNASTNHDKYGIETWIDKETSNTFSLANQIQNGLMSIYPYADKENADRGVKYANGALGEVNDNYLPFGILVEVAHHDYYDDALWIMQNKKLIGYNIADTILKYYQIID